MNPAPVDIRRAIAQPGVKTGDRVLISKYAGTEIKMDNVDYTILKQSDILAIVE